MPRSTIVVTGASGFVGRHLLASLKDEYHIIGLDWRSQEQGDIPSDPGITWAQADITDAPSLLNALEQATGDVRPDLVLHLAAYYDFDSEDRTDHYWATNVEGTRNMLDVCVKLGIRRFVFASSLAACQFPPPGGSLSEKSVPDGEHIYAKTKAAGEALLAQYDDRLHSVIVRFAAMFSDFCEYPPLFEFLRTWLSPAWNARILGGKGQSAIPYLHIRDAVRFLRTMLHQFDDLDQREIVIASPDSSTSHLELYRAATEAYYGAPRWALHVPRLLIAPGLWARLLLGRLTGNMPFERPWMAKYVDLAMNVDASRTRARLGYKPRRRLTLLRRLPLMIDNSTAYPGEWSRRNQSALNKSLSRPNLIIYTLLQHHASMISARLTKALTEKARASEFPSYQRLAEGERAWNHHLALNHLMSSVRTRERSFFVGYCADLAERRFAHGFSAEEVTSALAELEHVVTEVLRQDKAIVPIEACLRPHIGITFQFAIDEVKDVFEELEARRAYAATATPFSRRGSAPIDKELTSA